MMRVVGGDTRLDVEGVVDISKKIIASTVHHESSYMIVFAPAVNESWARDERHLAEMTVRCQAVDRQVGDFCRAHHIEYWDMARSADLKDPRPASLQGDKLHLDREGHKRMAEYQFGLALAMVERAMAATREGKVEAPASFAPPPVA